MVKKKFITNDPILTGPDMTNTEARSKVWLFNFWLKVRVRSSIYWFIFQIVAKARGGPGQSEVGTQNSKQVFQNGGKAPTTWAVLSRLPGCTVVRWAQPAWVSGHSIWDAGVPGIISTFAPNPCLIEKGFRKKYINVELSFGYYPWSVNLTCVLEFFNRFYFLEKF